MSGITLTIGDLAFAAPVALVALLLLVPLVAVLLARSARRRRADLVRFGDPALLRDTALLPSRAERIARGVLPVFALAMLLLALARPQWGVSSRTGRGVGTDVFFLLDLSRSMLAEDVAPSRLAAAKRAAESIAHALPDARVGLLVFGGSGFLQLPPTLDHSTFLRFLDAASPSELPDIATNFEAAADLTAATVQREGDTTGVALVMLSDGEDVEGKLMTAIGAFRKARVRVSTVGLGTVEGATIPDRDSTGAVVPHRDWAERVVVTRLNENNLRDIARLTGGTYVRWTGTSSVAPIVQAAAAVTPRAIDASTAIPFVDRFQWPLALALVALVVPAILGRGTRNGGRRTRDEGRAHAT